MENFDITDSTPFTSAELAFGRLYKIVKKLRSPDGCPWDKEQTPLTMRGPLIEETFEAVDAISQKDADHASEELGDVYLNTTMIASMYESEGEASVVKTINDVCDKIVRRHPHVWPASEGAAVAVEGATTNSGKVLEQWEAIKEKVEGRKKKCVLDEVAYGLPPLLRAFKIQKKAAKKGFDWDNIEEVWAKVNEEIGEVKEACKSGDKEEISAEVGDLLFAVVNISRYLGINPEIALASANEKFRRRYGYVEEKMEEAGIPMEKGNLKPMDKFWDEAKSKGL